MVFNLGVALAHRVQERVAGFGEGSITIIVLLGFRRFQS
jgi:hypothetical protein